MRQEVGLALPPLLERIQTWCEQDLQRHVERATSAQLQQTVGLKDFAIGGLIGAARAGLSWTWVQHVFSSTKPKLKKTKRALYESPV